MNRRIMCFLFASIIFIICLAGCTKAPSDSDLSMLPYPGIKWSATPDEVRQILNLTEDQIVLDTKVEADPEYEDSSEGWRLYVTDVTFFGQKVKYGLFFFVRAPWVDEFALSSIQLYYPDEADMTVVKDGLIKEYGEPKDGLGFTRYRIRSGAVESYTDQGATLVNYEGQASRMIHWWESPAKLADVFPADVQEAIIAKYSVPEFENNADREVVLEYLQKSPAVRIYCTDSSKSGTIGYPYYTKNVVYIDASDYTHQLQYYSK